MSTPPRPGRSGRRAKQARRDLAKFAELLEHAAERDLADVKPPPGIPDSEVIEGGPRLVLIRCKSCDDGQMKGVRRMRDGRLVVGVPWVELTGGAGRTVTTSCPVCGAVGMTPEARLVSAATKAEQTGKTTTIRIHGHKPR